MSTPRPSTTICVLVDGRDGLEVLMVRRSPTARFMGGAWVFPGGVVDEFDRSDRVAGLIDGLDETARPWFAAGVRELVEEVGLWLANPPFVRRMADDDPGAVWRAAEERGMRFDATGAVLFANWITPTMVPMRFDARFYAVAIPERLSCVPDDAEIDDAEWLRPATAIERAEAKDMVVPFPTRKTLEVLAGFAAAADVLAHFRAVEHVHPIQPRMRTTERGGLEALLPGDPGYDDIDESSGPDPEALRRAARAAGVPEVES